MDQKFLIAPIADHSPNITLPEWQNLLASGVLDCVIPRFGSRRPKMGKRKPRLIKSPPKIGVGFSAELFVTTKA